LGLQRGQAHAQRAEVVGQVDALAQPDPEQAVIDLRQRGHAAHDQVHAAPGLASGRGLGVALQQGADHLQVVPDPVLQLLRQQVFGIQRIPQRLDPSSGGDRFGLCHPPVQALNLGPQNPLAFLGALALPAVLSTSGNAKAHTLWPTSHSPPWMDV